MFNSDKEKKLSAWIFDSFQVTKEGLGLFRIFSALFILFFLLPSTSMYSFLGSLPSDFYTPPPGPMWFFEGFPPETFFLILHYVLILTLVCVLVGFKTSFASILVGLLLLVIKGFVYSIGKINHDLLLAVVPIVMAFSGWGAAYSIDSYVRNESRVVQSWPLTLLALFLGFMMFTAGSLKILGGWLSWETQATYGHFFKQFFLNGRQDLLAGHFLEVDSQFFWELLDYGTVLFEVGFLLAIFHPRTTRLFVSFAVVFHFSIMMILNIPFVPNFVAYAAFLNWPAINHRLRKWFNSKFAVPFALTGLFLIFVLIAFISKQLGFPNLESDMDHYQFYIVTLALPVAVGYIIRQILMINRRYDLLKTASSLKADNRD